MGNCTGLGIRFVFAYDAVFLDTPIAAADGHCASEDNRVGRGWDGNDLRRPDSGCEISGVAQGKRCLSPSFVDVLDLLSRFMRLLRLSELKLEGFQTRFGDEVGMR